MRRGVQSDLFGDLSKREAIGSQLSRAEKEIAAMLHNPPVIFLQPNARGTDPETSHLAADDATLRASEGRLRAMRALCSRPMTDFELAALYSMQQTSIGKRRGECMAAGLVRALEVDGVSIRRKAPSGSQAQVWEATEAGRQWYEAHKANE